MHSFKRRRETFAGGYIDIDKKQGRLTSNGSTAKRTLFFKVVSIAMAIAMIGTTATTVLPALLPKDTAQAATYTFHQPTIAVSKPVDFKDGSFEDMEATMVVSHTILNTYGTVNIPSSWTTKSQYWSTFPVSIAGNDGYGITSMNDPRCWLLEISNSPSTYGLSSVANGSNFAELNAYAAGRIYQNIATVPRSRIYWQFAHAGRTGASASTPDIMRFSLKPAGDVATAPTAVQQITATATSTDWTYHRGVYTVPTGQTNTQFGFEAVSSSIGHSDYGNLLDDIKFQTGASLIIEKGISNSSGTRIDGGYGEYSDVISIKIKVTNWGETDAAPCVMNDTLWDGLKFVSGTVTNPDGTTTSNVSCDTSGKVTAYIGTGATASAGGTLKGSQSMDTSGTTGKGEQTTVTIRAKITGAPGSTIYDQASVNYNDKGFENYNPTGGLTSYSLVDYQMDDTNDLGVTGKSGHYTMNILNPDGSTAVGYSNVNLSVQDTYVNRFTVVNRELDGTVWNDANENGKIDIGETK
jgi:uncharacterized repeat protein (TIGR01451 family)